MAHPELADWIERYTDVLTSRWIEAVRADSRIHSDADLSEDGLRDHIPALIEEVCQLIRTGEIPSLVNVREARVHAYVRFRQGYRASELVREMALLRLIILDHLTRGLVENSLATPQDAYVQTARLINQYIDEEMIYAIAVYTEAVG
ncbi:MAG TPA: RsbRD N-terminal domain-containing protein [Blastocatellia bacterium]|nr:RsbRD N-terminal domain-containing protein [Blastocatellia bacterium]